MEMEIKECGLLEYALRYEKLLDDQAGFFARIAVRNKGALLIGSVREEVAGAAVLNVVERDSFDLLYLYLRPEFRGRDLAAELIRAAREFAAGRGRNLSARVVEGREEEGRLTALAGRCGMSRAGTTEIFHSYPQREADIASWRDFMERKGSRICAHMEKKGYRTVDFAHAPEWTLLDLKAGVGTRFPAYLNPFAMITPRDDEFSFLTYQEGEGVVTYNTASSYGEGREKKIAQEMMANRTDRKRSGVFFPALAAFIDRTIERECARVTYTVYHHNQEMMKLTNGFLAPIIHSSRRQQIWRF